MYDSIFNRVKHLERPQGLIYISCGMQQGPDPDPDGYDIYVSCGIPPVNSEE